MFNEIHTKQFNRINELIRGSSTDEEEEEEKAGEPLDSEIVADALEDENYNK